MQDYNSMNRDELENLYLKAKAYYYEGREIMSDAEFDKLELLIKDRFPKSNVLSVVGYSSKRFEFKHKEKMLSLGKIQVNEEIDSEFEEIIKWTERSLDKKFIIQPKYDGNALSALYEDGKLIRVLTRGNGESGFDVTDKLNMPKEISIKDSIEIRGECLIDIKDFEKINKDDEFKNERNFVAGVLSNTKSSKHKKYLHFVAFAIVNLKKDRYIDVLKTLKENNFEICDYWLKDLNSINDVKLLYNEMKSYRENSPYRLDGFVIKINNEDIREKLGSNSHHPLSEIAIKFPADLSTTKIANIEWTMSSQRELVPTAILEPVLLDGSMVSRAYLANLKNIVSNSYFPGSIVAVQKKGDIIPQITKLIKKADLSDKEIEELKPKNCPFCSSVLEIDEELIHITCTNEECFEFLTKRLYKSVQILGIKNLGPSTVKRLYNSGIRHIRELFSDNLKELLSKSDEFKEGRELERILESIQAIRNVKYEDILRIEQVSGVGSSLSKALGDYYLDIDDNFSGFDKKLVSYMKENKKTYFDELISSWKKYIEVILPKKEESSTDITLAILTGSPKSAGYPTKKFFLDRFTNIRETKSFKDADILITNDLNSTSSKMKKAKDKGLKILRYEDFS